MLLDSWTVFFLHWNGDYERTEMCCKKYFFRCILILAAFGISIFAVTENLVEFIEVKGDPQQDIQGQASACTGTELDNACK